MDGILFLGWKSCVWDIKLKISLVSKSIPAAKSQNLVDISDAQKPTWAKFWEFDFFLSEKTRLYIYYENKNQHAVSSFIHESYNEIVDKIVFISSRMRQKWSFTIFWEAVSPFASDRLFIFTDFIVIQGIMQVN